MKIFWNTRKTSDPENCSKVHVDIVCIRDGEKIGKERERVGRKKWGRGRNGPIFSFFP